MYTHEQFLEILKEKWGNKISPIERYIKMRTPIYFRCNICGKEWKAAPGNVVGKHPSGCPKCGRDKQIKEQTFTNEEFLERVKGENVVFLEEYTGTANTIKTKCNVCGYTWDAFPSRFLYKKRKFPCPKCSKTIKKEQDEFEEEVKQKHNDKISIIGEYTRALNYVKAKCNICDYEWDCLAADLVKKNPVGCPRCNRNDGWDLNFFNKKFKILNPTITAIGVYEGACGNTRLKCDVCGYEWDRKRLLTSSLVKCTKCNHYDKSYGEYFIKTFLEKNNIKFERNFYFDDLKDIEYLRYDFWIESMNTLIEFNGSQHYEITIFGDMTRTQAVKKFFIQVKHDYMKRKYAREHGIKIITYKSTEIRQLGDMLERDILQKAA